MDRRVGGRPGWLVFAAALTTVALVATLALATSPAPAGARAICPNTDAPARTIELRKLRRSISCLIQHRRVNHGLRRLDPNRALRRAARRHNKLMLEANCFSHECRNEPDLLARVRAAGYLDGVSTFAVGENLGYAPTSGRMIRIWLADPLHRANILDRRFEDFGVAVAWGCPRDPDFAPCTNGQNATYTVDFGVRRP